MKAGEFAFEYMIPVLLVERMALTQFIDDVIKK
jgi:hypothetical protein